MKSENTITEQLKQGKHLIYIVRQNQCGGYFLNKLDKTKDTLCPSSSNIEDTFLFESFAPKEITEYINEHPHTRGHAYITEQESIQHTILKKENNIWQEYTIEQIRKISETEDEEIKIYKKTENIKNTESEIPKIMAKVYKIGEVKCKKN